jgi:hypothetical protein
MVAIVGNGQTAIDIALQECGAVEASFAICVLNNLTIYEALETGSLIETIAIVEKDIVQLLATEKRKPSSIYEEIGIVGIAGRSVGDVRNVDVNAAVVARNGQTPIDIALQECGAVEASFAICLLNNLTIYEAIESGLIVRSTDVIDNNLVEMLDSENRKPSSINNSIIALEGIGYWLISEDFIVS